MSLFRNLILALTGVLPALAFGQAAEIYNPAEAPSTTLHPPVPIQANPARIAATLLDTRSQMVTGIGTGAGGADVSMVQSVSLGMNTIGFGHQQSAGNRVADNFTVPAGGWVIDKVTTYAYQTGSTTTSTMNNLNFQIWNGPPNVVGSAVVFGDTTTNRMTATLFTGIYRVTETTISATTRPIMAVEAGGLNISLPAGTYWLDWQVGGTLASGPWAIPLTILGQAATGDALQFLASTTTPPGTWAAALDGGTGTPAQGFPMTLSGTVPGITVTQSGGTTDVTEGGATDTFTVALNTAPSSNVTITLTPDAQVSVSPATLTFTPANWNVAQTVTVTAVNDAIVEGTHTGNISFAVTSADTGYNAFAVANVVANITDNDVAGITVSPTTTSATEGGATGSFSVVLTSQPIAPVVIALTPDAQSTVSTGSLTFTGANWNVPQVVTVTAVNDAVVEGAHVSTIVTGAAVSMDPNYNGLNPPDITVNITDNDTAGVTVVQSGGSTNVSEAGGTDSFTVVLNSQPTANVVVTVTGGSQLTVSPATLTFTPANWNVPQTVTVAAVNDSLIEGPHVGTVSFAVTSSDGNYNGRNVAGVSVSIADNDEVPLAVPTLNGFGLLALLLLTFGTAGYVSRRRVARA